jgi:hypothetical protein
MLREDLYTPWFADKDWGFEFISGDFIGTVVQITELKFPEQSGEEASVDYHVIKKPEHVTDEDIKGDLFRSSFELVINDILKEAIENYENTKQQKL